MNSRLSQAPPPSYDTSFTGTVDKSLIFTANTNCIVNHKTFFSCFHDYLFPRKIKCSTKAANSTIGNVTVGTSSGMSGALNTQQCWQLYASLCSAVALCPSQRRRRRQRCRWAGFDRLSALLAVAECVGDFISPSIFTHRVTREKSKAIHSKLLEPPPPPPPTAATKSVIYKTATVRDSQAQPEHRASQPVHRSHVFRMCVDVCTLLNGIRGAARVWVECMETLEHFATDYALSLPSAPQSRRYGFALYRPPLRRTECCGMSFVCPNVCNSMCKV